MKYRINSSGYIVAERDIYSLGGFIPKGTVGGKVASEKQLSQDGECWLAGGDISTRPDIVIKDNAYVGTFTPGVNPVHTDGVTEFSGNTLIPGNISVRSFVADTKNNVFIKDSFIGVSMGVLCGPSTTATAFPFEQGRYNQDAPKGTLFTSGSMKISADSYVRNTATLRLGKNTYVYTPVGFSARIYWAYVDATGQLAYAGESEVCSKNLYKLSHPVYKVCMIAYARGSILTPDQLGTSGAKILGHVSGSLLMDLRPESVSGDYVIDNSSFIMNTDDFGLATTQLRFLAGGLFNTNMYTPTDRQDYKLYGTFRNVEHLEYSKDLDGSHRTAAKRDKYISAYDCPLLRVDNTTYNGSLAAIGDLVLRNCIVPKAEFQNDAINGNTYEDIDFSYANEDLGFTMVGYTRFISSHKRGIYRLIGGPTSAGFASHKGNLADTARLYQAEIYLPLDGNVIEQGTYSASIGQFYEEGKSGSISTGIRTGKPVSTFGLILPTMPSGYILAAAHYLDERLKFANSAANPSSINTDYPYVVFVITKADPSESALISEFIALNRTLRMIDHTKAPEITGSAYVGAGCTVHGDVKLIGDPYVNRLLDVNMWERGTTGDTLETWDDMTKGGPLPHRYRLVDVIPVEPGGSIECGEAYYIECNIFDINGRFLQRTGWTKSYKIPENGAFLGLVLRSVSDGLVENSDIPLANVKYVRAFKKRRYITNELDRTSPEDILLGPDFFEQGNLDLTAGGCYELAKRGDVSRLIFKRLLNAGRESTSTVNPTYVITKYAFDAITRFIAGGENLENRALAGNLIRREPESDITSEGISFTRMVIEFTPSPRIIVPYGSSTLFIRGPKIRMYDNAVLSRNLIQEGEIVLQGDAVMGYDFNPGSCMCSNGHDDAIIKEP